MANGTPRHRTLYEGDDDGSVLSTLAAQGLLPAGLEVVQRHHRRVNPGKDGMVKDIAALINPIGGAGLSAVAIRDADDLSSDQIRDWFTDRINAELPTHTPPLQVTSHVGGANVWHFRVEAPGLLRVGRAVVVSAGLPGGVAATHYKIIQFAIDDYVLLLAREQQVYDAVSEFKGVSYQLAFKKLAEIANLMSQNGIPIRHTKRLMHLLRAITGFRAAPATFAERLISQGLAVLGRDRVRELFRPLLESLEEASRLLSVAPPSGTAPTGP
jgi:hypothetical protein